MRLLIVGQGYTASRVRAHLEAKGARVAGTTRDGRGGTVAFADTDRVAFEIAHATHILSSVPPANGADPVLVAYGTALAETRATLAYLSSTGVYGDAGGAWVDESAAADAGRRPARNRADADWLKLGARVFRLPGIYGPGRSPLTRVAAGEAHRVDLPYQVFSRVHVDDIVAGVALGLDAPEGAYNLADDHPCSQNDVIAHAARLLGMPPPPFVPVERLSPMARGFYAENRRVANGKAKRVLRWRPAYPDYRLGLRALSAMTSPAIASDAPMPASHDQR